MKWFALIFALAIASSASRTRAEDGLALWARIYAVFSHPRCANCHVGSDNLPRWSGPSYGAPRPHGMHISAGDSRIGAETLACGTCHMKQNAELPHGPPGAETWLLPPVEMQWWQKSSAEICAQIKDPGRTGGRDLDAVAGHVETNKLVAWGWAPGPGREAAPYSAAEVAGFIRSWQAAGAPCPAQ
jgi:hypothetical protein